MKKLLMLGGKPIGSTEIAEYAKKKGIYTIVSDYLPESESPAKKISDEQWELSTADIEKLSEKVKKENVDGVIAGVHEFCIRKGIELCEQTGIESWCTLEQWDNCSNKKLFKEQCQSYGIDVAKTYKLNDDINYPVIVKPADSDGSRGFSICNNYEELEKGVQHALEFSDDYLVEEYMKCDACIIHYTAVDGEIIFSGISDKYSKPLDGGSMVMALQILPSRDEKRYFETVNEKAIKMFKGLGIKNGPIWIEAFNDGKRFVFNEMALRLGGSMTNYPVQYFTGIDQLELIVDAALGEKYNYVKEERKDKKQYAILPIHVKSGVLTKIVGQEEVKDFDFVQALVMVHQEGDEIDNWGTAQQVFCYLHITFDDKKEFIDNMNKVKEKLHAYDEKGNEQLFYLMNLEEWNG